MKVYSPAEARDYIEAFHGAPLKVVSDCLRGFLIPADGMKFVGGDFSSIEARALAWLAGEERVLQIFREGKDIYLVAASDIYQVPENSIAKKDPRRQVGKVAILALGYGGGKGAFQVMAKGYGVKVTDSEAETIKKAWRAKNQKIVAYWYDLERAAMNAIRNPGTNYVAGAKGREVTYRVNGSFLWCKLPSGGVMCYPYPRVDYLPTRWTDFNGDVVFKDTITYMAADSLTKQWVRSVTYGGSLAENVTQSLCTYILTDAIQGLEVEGYPVVIHVHDEAVAETLISNRNAVKDVERIMSKVPAWGAGFPIAVEAWEGERYQK